MILNLFQTYNDKKVLTTSDNSSDTRYHVYLNERVLRVAHVYTSTSHVNSSIQIILNVHVHVDVCWCMSPFGKFDLNSGLTKLTSHLVKRVHDIMGSTCTHCSLRERRLHVCLYVNTCIV